MRKIRKTALFAGPLVLLGLAASAPAVVETGTVVKFRGIAGANLGMSRAAVIAKLGPPLHQSAFGVLSYSNKNILDVYLTRTGPKGRVRQVIASGSGFCAQGVPAACSLKPGSVTAMTHAFPGKFRRVVDFTGDTIYWWCGRVRGRAVSTSFNADPKRHMILTWYLTVRGAHCPTLTQVRNGT
ncbi:MAG: hypothetical protein U0Y82_10790 [Thermoleophilia bacterium]